MHNVCSSNYDFIGLCEIWLPPNVITAKLGLLNYTIYHCGRNYY